MHIHLSVVLNSFIAHRHSHRQRKVSRNEYETETGTGTMSSIFRNVLISNGSEMWLFCLHTDFCISNMLFLWLKYELEF